MKRCTLAGLTLIEILVVTGILALLGSLALPAVGHARAVARDVECRANLRQWGVGLAMYMNDYSGYIPRRGQGSRELGRLERSEDWFNCLPPYLDELPYRDLVEQGKRPRAGDKSVFICPSATDAGGRYFLPYAMNKFLCTWLDADQVNMMNVPEPSAVVFLADAPGPYSSTAPSKDRSSVQPRHEGSANVLFLDGHVRSFTGEYLGCGRGDRMQPDVHWQILD